MDKDGTVHAAYWVRTGLGPAATPPPVRPIVYRRSTDQGRTWSPPVDIDPGNVAPSQPALQAADHGATFGTPVRVNDRGIDRSKGVWSNNIESKFNVGVAATDDEVYFAWQDTRNAIGETGSEDVYFSAVPLKAAAAAESTGGTPGWTLALTTLFGLGLGVTIAWLLVRRRDGQPQAAAARGSAARV